MRLTIAKARSVSQSGFTLVEVLVSAVIFAGVFLILFALLGRVLTNSSGADMLRVATLADLRLARFHEGCAESPSPEYVDLDGIRFRVSAYSTKSEWRENLRIVISRENAIDTLGVFYGVRYVSQE